MTWAAIIAAARGIWGKIAAGAAIVAAILLALWRMRAAAREAGRQDVRQEQQDQARKNVETRHEVEDSLRRDPPAARRDRLRDWSSRDRL